VQEQLAAVQQQLATIQEQSGNVQGELDTVHELEGQWHALACDAVIHTEERHLELDVLKDAALAAIDTVSPMATNLEESLRALPMRVMVVLTHGVRHGASTALATAQL